MEDFAFLSTASPETAKRLLGCELQRTMSNGSVLSGVIVETEYYEQTDVASHSYRGKTKRNAVMFGPAGHLYVYFTYGMHYCSNIVVGEDGYSAAVLIRAVEPTKGITQMAKNRGVKKDSVSLTNGPAKLCQSFKIDRTFNGHKLTDIPIKLIIHKQIDDDYITQTTRIGITKGQDMKWRFYISKNPYVSKR